LGLVDGLTQSLPTLEQIVVWGGYLGLFLIVFAETGLLVGFLLPGDSLLVTAGLLIASGTVPLDIVWLNVLLCTAAVTGDATGYYIGLRGGHALYSRPQSRIFRRDHLLKTRAFYDTYGGVTIVLARFMPFARTFAPVVAGVAQMPYRRFAGFNIAGGVGWVVSMTMLGYVAGRAIPGIEHYIEYVVVVIVLLSVMPMVVKYLQHRYRTRATTRNTG
jgi:membrane-associated protein